MNKYSKYDIVDLVEHCINDGVWGDYEDVIDELSNQSCSYVDLVNFIEITKDKDNFVELLEDYLG